MYGFCQSVLRVFKIVFTICFGVAALGAFSFILILSYHQLVHSSYFQVKNVVLKDINRISESEVIELTGLDKPTNILALKLDVLAENLRDHPWVNNVCLTRKMPDTIIIEIEEHQPRSLIKLGGLYYLDDFGNPFKKVDAQDRVDLPVITGFSTTDFKKRPKLTRQELKDIFLFMDVLAKRNDRFRLENIAEINFDPVRGLHLLTRENNLQVKVGFGDYQAKFRRLGRVLAHLKITGNEQGLIYVNLECGSRVIIRRSVQS